MNPFPKIIAVDLDGTVFGPDHKTISARTMQTLKRYIDRGTLLIPTTGRSKVIVPMESFPYVRYLISSNGGCVTDLEMGKPLRQTYLPGQLAKLAWNMVKDRVNAQHVVMELFVKDQIVVEKKVYDHFLFYMEKIPGFHRPYIGNGQAIYTRCFDEYLEEHDDQIEKINFPGKSIAGCQEIREELIETGLFEITSDGLNLEVNRKGCHKGEALLWLAQQLGAGREEIVAFGNGNNDIPMLTSVGYGVAMGNSAPDVKAAAKYTTASNTQDGIADFLEKFFPLGEE